MIKSDRCVLRQPDPADMAIYEKLYCYSEMMRYLGGTWTPQKVSEALQEWRDMWGRNDCWYGSLVEKASGVVIGMAGFTKDTIPDEPGLELSWFVLPEYQARGYASEVSAALIRFAFEDLRAERMVSETHPQNDSAQRVLQKLGFTCLGERHHSYESLPGFDTQSFWELTRTRWETNKT